MGLWDWDVRTNTSVWNAIEYQLLGLPVGDEKVSTSLFFDRLHPEDAGPFHTILSEVMESGSEFYHEVRIRRADGQERLACRRRPTQPRRVRSAAEDDRRELRYNRSQAGRRQASRSCAEAEAANRAKDRFLAILSHEFRGPLTPILMTLAYWETLSEQLPADFQQDMSTIRRNIDFQMRLIDDLLDFNSIAAGKLSIRAEQIDVHVVLRRCLDANRGHLESKGLAAVCSLRASSGNTNADPARLEQVFGNVLRNAIKFTATGRIDIETEDFPGDGTEPRFIRRSHSRHRYRHRRGISPECPLRPSNKAAKIARASTADWDSVSPSAVRSCKRTAAESPPPATAPTRAQRLQSISRPLLLRPFLKAFLHGKSV